MLYSSCRKTDELIKDNSIISAEEKFFTNYRSNDATENELLNYIRQQNEQLGFVAKTVNQIGYPRWNKMIAIKSKSSGIAGRETGSGDSTTLYYVPFVRDSQNYVNASMVISASATDTSFWYYCDWQYKSLPYTETGTTGFTAERYAMMFMFMDSLTLGHSRFNITDSLLFRSPGHSHTEKVIGLKTVSGSGRGGGTIANSNSQGCIDWYYCGSPAWCQANYGTNGCDYMNCRDDVCRLYEDYCFDLPETGGGGFPDEPIPVDPGGGGNGSGGGGTPPDCGEPQGRGIAARGDLPCDEDPGWEPEPIEDNPPVTPCESLMSLFTQPALNTKSIINDNLKTFIQTHPSGEAGAAFRIAPNGTASFTMLPSTTALQLEIPAGGNVYSAIHCHSNNGYPMFSWSDIFSLYLMWARRPAHVNFRPSFLLTCKDDNGVYQTYAIIIEDIGTTLGEFFTNSENVGCTQDEIVTKKNDKLFKEYSYEENNNSNYELAFLRSIFGLNVSLYKANTNLTNWSKLGINNNASNATVNSTNCN